MATRALASTDFPLIVILGSTATGKTKLSIGLAKALNGEIISADSMQVYKGLDIITNKATVEEQKEIPHHLINIISPPSEFTVVQFKEMTLKIIENLFKENKIPIIVGGTNYYIESLLWDFLVSNKESDDDKDEALQQRKNIGNTCEGGKSKCDEQTDLYERLKKVDPQRADQLHPNNVRKVARSLQIFDTTGKTHSELLIDQKRKYGSSHLSGPLRFSRTLVFWLTCNQEVLDQRISGRMEKMVEEGLANEISEFYKQYRLEKGYGKIMKHKDEVLLQVSAQDHNKIEGQLQFGNTVVDNNTEHSDADEETSNSDDKTSPSLMETYDSGLFQAIGFKEFHSYITSEDVDIEKNKMLFQNGLDKLKRRTIKYSKKQQTWVRNRFLGRPGHNVPDVYDLDVTNLEKWNEDVLEKALKITKAFIKGDSIPFTPMAKIASAGKGFENRKYVCDLCNGKIIIGDTAWEAHHASKKHKKMTSRKRKLSLDNDGIS